MSDFTIITMSDEEYHKEMVEEYQSEHERHMELAYECARLYRLRGFKCSVINKRNPRFVENPTKEERDSAPSHTVDWDYQPPTVKVFKDSTYDFFERLEKLHQTMPEPYYGTVVDEQGGVVIYDIMGEYL
mgnify:CR=1 FL=1